ncbi:putative ribosomal large subunit pseudouridine synthase SVR1, chloroplastic isoform X1 [Juglans microcarpa x Juglans regia]|uniref:putative ribosomal large subunit pseudouridine synthase SVR1, chloroplastic isoform X1 n=2 Tax=Juglans microcarpa x Juglans regia TaxID=2249226 RepID=UPI001B7E93BA|nr:putative ribosomal large subunit pseudouridine synthase SVR1, chloroplastic isoform X1 [Juglans microcarpa x Juglans regia]
MKSKTPIFQQMATVMASFSTLHHLSFSLFSNPSLSLRPFRSFPRIINCSRSSLSSSSSSSSSPSTSSLQFNISFAPPKPKPKPPVSDQLLDPDDLSSDQLIIPWIVRGEDGNLKLQMHPPARLLHAMANAETEKKKNKKKDKSPDKVSLEPKYSKAARRFFNENFKKPEQRLSKVLAATGVASRRNSEELIFEGKVTVNGSVCKAPQTRVDPARDVIYVNGNRLPKKQPPKVYFALNKPKGYICSSGDVESKSVLCLFDEYLKSWGKKYPGLPKPRLFTVGRLDVATTGLIIVTNDGDCAQRLSHPSSNLTKEYIAAIDGIVTRRHLFAISEGTVIEGIHCTPDSVELLPRQTDISRPRLRIVVHDGRKHEVRELVKSAGLEIHSLKRVRIGGFRLPSDLGLGKHIELKQSDLKLLGGIS